MKYTIRRAKADDIQKVIDLAVEMVVHSLSPYRETSRDEIREFRRTDLAVLKNAERHENIGIFIAEDEDNNFIGHVIVVGGDVETSTGEKQGWVFDLSVKEEHWKSGIGKTLMLKAEEFVKGLGLKYLGMGVTTSNERAVRFYERCGYAEERKRMIKKFQA